MGLDMYLDKKLYIWRDKRKGVSLRGLPTRVKASEVKQIECEAGYWRKANAIHQWFVENVQNGEDDCKEYYVEREQLQELLDTVNKVLDSVKMVKGKIQNGTKFENGKSEPILEDGSYIKDPSIAEELLPTTEGFFFGGTAYDQYYVDDLKLTKKILTKALKEPKDWEFYYQSSW